MLLGSPALPTTLVKPTHRLGPVIVKDRTELIELPTELVELSSVRGMPLGALIFPTMDITFRLPMKAVQLLAT